MKVVKTIIDTILDLILASLWVIGCLLPYIVTFFDTVQKRAFVGLGGFILVLLIFAGVCHLKFSIKGFQK